MIRRSAPLVGLLVLLLSGCFKIDFKITVEDDGSGSIEGLLALDANAAAEFGSAFDLEGADVPSREELCNEFLSDSDVPTEATTEPYNEGDFCGVRFSQDFTADEMDQVLAESFQDEGGEFVIRRDGDGWRFDAALSDDAGAGSEFFPDELFSDAEFKIRVKLPGRQVEHNADFIESDGTMVWEIDPFNPGPDLMARTEPGATITGSGGGDDGGSNTVLIVVLVLAALALAAGGFWWWRSRSAGAAADTGEPDPAGLGESDLAPPVGPPPADPPPTDPPAGSPPPPPPPA